MNTWHSAPPSVREITPSSWRKYARRKWRKGKCWFNLAVNDHRTTPSRRRVPFRAFSRFATNDDWILQLCKYGGVVKREHYLWAFVYFPSFFLPFLSPFSSASGGRNGNAPATREYPGWGRACGGGGGGGHEKGGIFSLQDLRRPSIGERANECKASRSFPVWIAGKSTVTPTRVSLYLFSCCPLVPSSGDGGPFTSARGVNF